MNVKLHTLAFKGSQAAETVEDGTALIHGVLELDGQLIRNAKVRIHTKGGGIVMVSAQILPSSLEVVVHDRSSWDELDAP